MKQSDQIRRIGCTKNYQLTNRWIQNWPGVFLERAFRRTRMACES